MPIQIANKIKAYKKEISNFVSFINSNNDIPDKIFLNTFNTPFVFDSNNKPSFGLFYKDENENLRIAVAIKIKDLEKFKYKDITFSRQDCLYIILETIAHEFLHYIQYKNNKKFYEKGLDNKALNMIKKYNQKGERVKKLEC